MAFTLDGLWQKATAESAALGLILKVHARLPAKGRYHCGAIAPRRCVPANGLSGAQIVAEVVRSGTWLQELHGHPDCARPQVP